jgi:AI-2 transport protein TqsA
LNEDTENSRNRSSRTEWERQVRTASLVAASLILSGWALGAMAPIAVPIVFSLFLALLVAPVDNWVKRHVPSRIGWLGHLAAMGLILVTLALAVALIGLAAQQLTQAFPLNEDDMTSMLPMGAPAEGSSGGVLPDALRGFGDTLTQWIAQRAQNVVMAASAIVASAVLVFFLTLIMLVEAPRWRDKMATLLSKRAEQDGLRSVRIIASRLRYYLWVRTLLGLLTALLYVAWLSLFDIDLLLVWAMLAFLMNYVPTLGSMVAGLLPILYAFLQKDFATAFGVGAGILIIEQLMGNYVDPVVQGKQLSVSSLVVLMSLLFWSWLWGIAGALLAMPITISIIVVCAHIVPLRTIAVLLSDETDAASLDRTLSKE